MYCFLTNGSEARFYWANRAFRTPFVKTPISGGKEPDPQRTPWKTFLQAHWEGLAACDLFTVEVLTLDGLKRYLVLFVIELKTRYIHIAGIHPLPDGAWMEQMARNLTDPDEGFLRTAHHLIQDRDPLYTRLFEEILRSAGVPPVRLPARSPNLNAYAERLSTIWNDRLAIVTSSCVSMRQGGMCHRDRGLTLAGSEPQTKGTDHERAYHLRRY